ncbi:MAG: hypothetical protein HFG16_08250 [Erysipelotrichaceae bacterium]|jgi:NTE family protein|nr:hypothetical protein [Erysipelotrichaceae bacterium]
MRGKALVFSGGGAKGAYEVGVWKAMSELGIDRHIRMVAGTSVGALNAALFAQGDREEALCLWSMISNAHILTSHDVCKSCKAELEEEEKRKLCMQLMQAQRLPLAKTTFAQKAGAVFYKWVVACFISRMERTLSMSLAKALVPCFLDILGELKATHDFQFAVNKTIYFVQSILREGLFSQQGLHQIIDEYYRPQRLLHSPVKMNATAYNTTGRHIEHFNFSAANQSLHKDILLASCAIPFVFDSIAIRGNTYIDGGIPFVGDNTPIDVVYAAGYRDIIAVVLHADEVDIRDFKDAKITIVQPAESLGSAMRSLDFHEDYTRDLIQKGYADGRRIFS